MNRERSVKKKKMLWKALTNRDAEFKQKGTTAVKKV